MEQEKTVYCPVIDGQINGGNCYEVCAVADREVKPRILYDEPSILPPGTEWTEELRRVCLQCLYHVGSPYYD